MPMVRVLAALPALVLLAVLLSRGDCFGFGEEQAVVARVVDGDSLRVVQQHRSLEVRLWGIDAPEHGQRYADAAKSQCRRLVEGRTIVLRRKYVDRYGRIVALVWVDGRLLNRELVRQGTVWVHDRYCDEAVCAAWNDLEQEARLRRIGLWRDDSPVAPWVWKGRQRSGRPRSD